MELTQVLLRRAAALSFACLLCVLLLAVWQTRSDVHEESEGASELAQLTRQLMDLQSVSADRVDEQIEALRRLGAEGRLRHLQFRIEDAAGGEVFAQSKTDDASPVALRAFMWLLNLVPAPPAAKEVAWVVERGDGRGFRIALFTHPYSEQREAYDEFLGASGVLLLYSVSLLAAMYWALRHAFAPLRQILDTIGAFERHDFDVRLPALRIRELDAIGRALNHLAAALRQAQEERRLLSVKLLTLQEDERAHIARELHDELGQSLTAIRVDAAYLLRQTEGQAELHGVVSELEQQCARVQGDVRNLLGWLGSPADGGTGETVPIVDLLEGLVRSWRQRPGQTIDYELTVDLDSALVPRSLALNLYRMTQEALTNVARHAGAGRVEVRLAIHPADARLHWSVCDDGVGIASYAEALQRGSGLAAIRERVWAHGGDLAVLDRTSGGSQRGLALQAWFPLPAM